MNSLFEWRAFKYLEWEAIGYYLYFLWKKLVFSGMVQAALYASASLLFGVFAAFLALIFLPRVVEDYVKIYNWYVNSDFHKIFEEKVDVRLVFRLLALPFALLISLIFFVINLAVRSAYDLAFRLNLLRCVNCRTTISWGEGTVHCHVCGDKVVGSAVHSCPGCHFKANAIRCPYCGFVVFVGLHGEHPSARAEKRG